MKEAVATQLAELSPSGDSKTDKLIEKALEDLFGSLEDEFWLDDSHLVLDSDGKKVFDREKKAAKELQKIRDDKKAPTAARESVVPLLDQLVEADELLASTLVGEAELQCANSKCQKEIAKALEELAKATEDVADGDVDKAIGYYRKAWDSARKAFDRL